MSAGEYDRLKYVIVGLLKRLFYVHGNVVNVVWVHVCMFFTCPPVGGNRDGVMYRVWDWKDGEGGGRDG